MSHVQAFEPHQLASGAVVHRPRKTDSRRCQNESCGIRLTSFGHSKRKHCKNCGRSFCSSCLSTRTVIPALGYDEEVHVCPACVVQMGEMKLQIPVRSQRTVQSASELGSSNKPKKSGTHIVCVARVAWCVTDGATQCLDCNSIFGMLSWRFHCRVCGNVFCRSCTRNRIVHCVEPGFERLIRVCHTCNQELHARAQQESQELNPTPRQVKLDSMKRTSEPFISHRSRLGHGLGGSIARRNSRHSRAGLPSASVSSMAMDASDTKTIVVKFNLDPKKTVRLLIAQDAVANSPKAVATFLRSTKGLSKTAIGNYLSKDDEFVKNVFDEFVSEVNLIGVRFDDALRMFLDGWKMVGEAQIVERTMQKFADKYCEQNPDVFENPDTAFVLAFSLIMLNSDLHNPAVKQHMNLSQFIANNRGIDNGQDLPASLLVDLFHSIEQNPLKLDDKSIRYGECVTFCLNNLEGWLLKQSSHSTSTWNRRWFVLTDGCLYYFDHPQQPSPKCIFPLEDVRVRPIQKSVLDFEIYPRTDDSTLKSMKTTNGMMQGQRRELVLRANTETERDNWMQAISQEATTSPLSEIWRKKRNMIASASRTDLTRHQKS